MNIDKKQFETVMTENFDKIQLLRLNYLAAQLKEEE